MGSPFHPHWQREKSLGSFLEHHELSLAPCFRLNLAKRLALTYSFFRKLQRQRCYKGGESSLDSCRKRTSWSYGPSTSMPPAPGIRAEWSPTRMPSATQI